VTYRAFVVDKQDDQFSAEVRELDESGLPEGEVTVRVEWSSVNYKDGLACLPKSPVIRNYPMVPGIDAAGTVEASTDARFKPGDKVILTGFNTGVTHPGGYAERARVPADWLVALPSGLSAKEAMALGTAGLTAAMSVHYLEKQGLRADQGPVLVTGATGGVGCTAVSMLANLGYEVAASTGKEDSHDWLRALGAKEILSREEVSAPSERTMEKERWAAAVDPVGGATTAYLLRTVKYAGAVALSGLTGGVAIDTSVHPFILRGVSLLGVESVTCPMELRQELWARMASDLKPKGLLDQIVKEATLDDIPEAAQTILAGGVRGRIVVKP
jgi:putative YhdH/YhfP family quinone oxidoreductase